MRLGHIDAPAIICGLLSGSRKFRMPTDGKPVEARSGGTDWERVQREAAADAPIAYDPATDACVEPYDPNDEAAIASHWAMAAQEVEIP